MSDKERQVAAIPIRRGPHGALRVLLVTSRETRRWVVPKGWPWPGHADHEAAAGEAREEAGVLGRSHAVSIGSFTYLKRKGNKSRDLQVSVYLLEVDTELEDWPEAHERRRAWFTVADAAGAVAEPELKALILRLDDRPAET